MKSNKFYKLFIASLIAFAYSDYQHQEVMTSKRLIIVAVLLLVLGSTNTQIVTEQIPLGMCAYLWIELEDISGIFDY